jgi:hypothetical protein
MVVVLLLPKSPSSFEKVIDSATGKAFEGMHDGRERILLTRRQEKMDMIRHDNRGNELGSSLLIQPLQ